MSGKDGKGGKDGKVKRFRRTWRAVAARVLFCLPALPAFPVLPAFAQTEPRLVEAIRQAQEGRGDSARTKVRRLLAATSPTDTLYPQIVYTQAMVASDANEMRRQLQRVAVEYPSSSWADDALLRLVQLDYASGNLPGAARNLELIRNDYPGSILLPQASYWAARTYFDQKNPELACRWIADGLAASSSNVELQNQLGYLDQRCAGMRANVATRPATDSQAAATGGGTDTAALPPERADSTTRPASTPPPAAAPTQPAPSAPARPEPVATAPPRAEPTPVSSRPTASVRRFRVQVTAVRSPSAAAAAAARLQALGLTPVTTEEGGLFKVRVGDYATRPEAVAALPDLKAKLGGSPFVVTEP
jgi:cell division septation protein DedD